MKAIVITQNQEPLELNQVDKPSASKDLCIVKLSYSALNRRDQWIREGMYPGIRPGTILGSDGCGEVVEGPKEWLGKHVIINPNVDWGENEDVQSDSYSVLGMPTNGTLADYLLIPAHRLHEKPDHLTEAEAAALPLAGLTAFRATIKKGKASDGKNILVTGIGGGVSQFALAFAAAKGAKVFVTSSSDDKIAKAVEAGAKGGFNYKDEGWTKKAQEIGGFDSIIDSAGGSELNTYLKLIKPGGRIVMYGSTTGYPEKVDVFRLFWSQAQIMGSTMGSDIEFEEMVSFVNQHKIKPVIDQVYSIDEYIAAFDRFKSKEHYGKIVLSVASFS